MEKELSSVEKAGIHLTFNTSLLIIVLTGLGLFFYELIEPVSVTKNELVLCFGFGMLGMLSVFFKLWKFNKDGN